MKLYPYSIIISQVVTNNSSLNFNYVQPKLDIFQLV